MLASRMLYIDIFLQICVYNQNFCVYNLAFRYLWQSNFFLNVIQGSLVRDRLYGVIGRGQVFSAILRLQKNGPRQVDVERSHQTRKVIYSCICLISATLQSGKRRGFSSLFPNASFTRNSQNQSDFCCPTDFCKHPTDGHHIAQNRTERQENSYLENWTDSLAKSVVDDKNQKHHCSCKRDINE